MKNNQPRIAKATGIVSIFTLLSRVLGLARDTFIASYFGAGSSADAFFVAFRIPNLLRRLVAEGSLSTAFVPIFSEELEKSPSHAQKALSETLFLSLASTIALALVGVYYAQDITYLFAPGFGVDTPKSQLASALLQIMFPYVILISLVAIISSALNSLGHFALPAFAPALLNCSMILAVVLLHSFFAVPIYTLAVGVVVGGILQFLLQIPPLRTLGFRLSVRPNLRSEVVKKLVKLMIPTVWSASLYQFMVFINSLLASALAEGSVSWLYYAERVFQFPLGIFSIALATAILPALSRLVAQQKYSEVENRLNMALSWVNFITIPATVGLVLLAHPICNLLFGYGNTTARDTSQIAGALQAMSIGLWAVSMQGVLVRVYLAHHNSRTPAIIATVSVVVNIIVSLSLMGSLKEQDGLYLGIISSVQRVLQVASIGHLGLAMAGTISSLFSTILLSLMLFKINTHLGYSKLAISVIRSSAAASAMGLFIWLAQNYIHSQVALVMATIPGGVLVYVLFATIFRCQELVELLSYCKPARNTKTS